MPLLPPGVALANAVGVHDTSTSELAVGLALAVLRGFPDFVRAGDQGRWTQGRHRSLADRRVLVVGFGGVGRAVASRLNAFEAHVTAVASRPARRGRTRPRSVSTRCTGSTSSPRCCPSTTSSS